AGRVDQQRSLALDATNHADSVAHQVHQKLKQLFDNLLLLEMFLPQDGYLAPKSLILLLQTVQLRVDRLLATFDRLDIGQYLLHLVHLDDAGSQALAVVGQLKTLATFEWKCERRVRAYLSFDELQLLFFAFNEVVVEKLDPVSVRLEATLFDVG